MSRLTRNQRSGISMLASGHRPRKVTLDALIDRGLATGPCHNPALTAAGRHFAKHGELPARSNG